MKKLASLFLVLVMVCSLATTAFAYTTSVTYEGQGQEAYEVTVPSTLTPGDSAGVVKVLGTWASNRTVNVTAPSTVVLTNSIDSGTKTASVSFVGIAKAGDNTVSVSDSVAISVAAIEDALFGTWTGTITYDVSITGGVELITFTVEQELASGSITTTCYAEAGMTWAEWVDSEYNTINAEVSDSEVCIFGCGTGQNYATAAPIQLTDTVNAGGHYYFGLGEII